MRRSLAPLLAAVVALLALATLASADPGDGGPFRRTTPRADVIRSGDWTLLGIPGGRAWGLESGLRPLDGVTEIALELAVLDPAVREAFLRIAYYARPAGRSRQLATADSAAVTIAEGPAGLTVAVPLTPPRGAVAYRIRLLGRLFGRQDRTAAGAIRVRPGPPPGPAAPRPSLTRLRAEPP